MISMKDAPVSWAMLMYDLDDAREDLESLLTEMRNNDAEVDEEYFRIRLSHIYWHLNRAWNHRDVPDDLLETDDLNAGQFPHDLEPG
jgi:hypothetical protein